MYYLLFYIDEEILYKCQSASKAVVTFDAAQLKL